MSKLQSNFTTIEQSKRLLELGLPAGSADCYFTESGKIEIKNTAFDILYTPCWSVGQLIDIFIICTPYVEIKLRTRLIEQLIASYEDVIKQGLIDFSKLEE